MTLAALTAAALLASCAQPPPPPAPAPPPSVSLSSKVIEQASAYRAYVGRASAISPAFANGQQVSDAVRTGAAYQPDQLLRGAIAYGAVAALQDSTFVTGVRAYVGDATQRQTIAYHIMRDPAYVVGISGSASAAGLVIAALGDNGRKVLDQGRQVKQAAYDVQHSAWSKGEVAGRDARLLQAKQLSMTPGLGEVEETARLQQASVGAQSLALTGTAVPPPYSPMVIRSLAVAALAALGYADDAHLDHVAPLMTDPASATCLNMSKLNLYQCLAVSKPYYEDVFCLGQHVMEDTGACLMKGAGVAVPPDPIIEAAKARAAEAAAARPARTSAKRPPPRRVKR
ncbi:hypothetical protein LJR225_002588 [Phenylobacterium sp. LjRoot225]|uniref:hypothetical protein n=1 Tax=Phenylobacterium sp. LjRoot225 TaxID=3342285 RepID=UPI003ECD0113